MIDCGRHSEDEKRFLEAVADYYGWCADLGVPPCATSWVDYLASPRFYVLSTSRADRVAPRSALKPSKRLVAVRGHYRR